MDLDSINALNLAARTNDVSIVRRMLKTMDPNCSDKRGWTCLHEAADNDSYKCVKVILKHPKCRPLTETHEGYTALYLACIQGASVKLIKALLKAAKDIVNYCCFELVTPLHIVSRQNRVDLIELFIQHGAIIDSRDADGYTALLVSAPELQHEALAALLHAGADPLIRVGAHCLSVFHLACTRGCLESVKNLQPFIADVNHLTSTGDTPLMCALQGVNSDVIHYLLANGADPNITNYFGFQALDEAIYLGYTEIISTLLDVTDDISPEVVAVACRRHNFKFDILEIILSHDLDIEYLSTIKFCTYLEDVGGYRPVYHNSTPLCEFLEIAEYIYNKSVDQFMRIFFLFMMRGVDANAIDAKECPPLVYIHYCDHEDCFKAIFEILLDHGCNVDYCSSYSCVDKDKCLPDAFHASLTKDLTTLPIMLPYSLCCEPEAILKIINKSGQIYDSEIQQKLVNRIYNCDVDISSEYLMYYVQPLKHLARLKVRSNLRKVPGGFKSATEFIKVVNDLPVPKVIKDYIRYL